MTRRWNPARRIALIGLCLLGGSGVVHAETAAVTYFCPPFPYVGKEPARFGAWVLEGAEPQDPTKHRVETVTLFRGHPSQGREPKVSQVDAHIDIWTTIWRLPRARDGYWLKCSYEDTPAGFVRPLPAGTRRCSLTVDTGTEAGQRPSEMTCGD